MSSVFVPLQTGSTSELYDECREVYRDALRWIGEDLSSVPAHQRDWVIGRSFSWHRVKITEYRIAQFIRSLECFVMAATKKGKKSNASFQGYTFVKCELSTEDRKAAKVWIEANAAEFGPMLHDVIASDYKFTCSFSSEHDTFTACLVGKEDNVFNAQKTLTARHKDWVMAALTVLYKHSVIFRSTIWESADAEDDDGWA